MKISHQNISVIILAGGQSHRAETIKGLRQINGEYWLDKQIEFFKVFGIDLIFIGLGYHHKDYLNQCKMIGLSKPIINPNPQLGSFSTLQNTLQSSLEESWDKTLLIHIDHALPKKNTILKLINTNNFDVIKPTYRQKSGHPIVMSRALCESLLQKNINSKLNTEIRKLDIAKVSWIEVDDENIHSNFNTMTQWQEYKRTFKIL